MEKLYKGQSIIVDYEALGNGEIKDFFDNASNFEGWATIDNIREGYITIEGTINTIGNEYIIICEGEDLEYYI